MATGKKFEMFDFSRRNMKELLRLTHSYFSELRKYDDSLKFAEGWESRYRRLMEGAAGAPRYFVRGARLNGKTVGFIMFGCRDEPMWVTRRRGYLSNIYVMPPHRRKGLGTFMVEGALQTLRQMEAEVVDLDVYVTNESGRIFWESFGFSPFKERLRLKMTT